MIAAGNLLWIPPTTRALLAGKRERAVPFDRRSCRCRRSGFSRRERVATNLRRSTLELLTAAPISSCARHAALQSGRRRQSRMASMPRSQVATRDGGCRCTSGRAPAPLPSVSGAQLLLPLPLLVDNKQCQC